MRFETFFLFFAYRWFAPLNQISRKGFVQMDSATVLNLLEKMKVDANAKDSTEISWKAYRTAEKLNDPSLLPVLCLLIQDNDNNKQKELRKNIYFLMGSLLRKKMNVEYCQFLIDRLEIETDKYVLSSMLNQISKLQIPNEINMNHVIECSRSDQWLVRHNAINALHASDSELCREAARYWAKQLDEKKYKYEIIFANACLNKIGVMEDIEILDLHTHSRIRDIKDSTLFAIEAIKSRYASG